MKIINIAVALLKSGNGIIRVRAAQLLIRRGLPAVIPLIASMKDNDEVFRYIAAEVMGRIVGDERYYWEEDEFRKDISITPQGINRARIVALLVKALGRLAAENRDFVLRAIAALGYEEAAQTLIELSQEFRYEDYKILELLPLVGKAAEKPLIKELNKKHQKKDLDRLYAMLEALGKIGGEESGDCLRKLLSDGNVRVRCAATMALEKTGCMREADLFQLFQEQDKWLSVWALSMLAKRDAPGIKQILLYLLKGNDFIMRDRAAEILSETDDEEMADALVALLNNSDSNIRRGAAEALGGICSERVRPALVKSLKDENKYVRMAAEAALGRERTGKDQRL